MKCGTLVDGMNGDAAAVAAEDFKKLLSHHGLNLIAERVEDEKTVLQLLDYAVDYAQGYLFGEPRAVRDDATRPAEREPSVIPFKKRRRGFAALTASRASAIRRSCPSGSLTAFPTLPISMTR